MLGSGKSTVASRLAKELNYPLVDLDHMIEYDAKMFIDEIFFRYGESKFRALETEALKKIQKPNAVISCGGGIVLDEKNKPLMDGVKIYIHTDLEIIKERLKNDYQRPLLKTKSLEHIYFERNQKYQSFLDIEVDNNQEVDQTVDKIILKLKERELL